MLWNTKQTLKQKSSQTDYFWIITYGAKNATHTTTLWITLASISTHTRHLIYFLSAITGLHVHGFLELCFHTSGSIIADHMSGYG